MWHVLNREGGYDEWPDVAVGVTHSLAQLEVIDKVHGVARETFALENYDAT
jgi:hypothetical protein